MPSPTRVYICTFAHPHQPTRVLYFQEYDPATNVATGVFERPDLPGQRWTFPVSLVVPGGSPLDFANPAAHAFIRQAAFDQAYAQRERRPSNGRWLDG